MSNLADFLYRSAEVYPNKTAVRFDGQKISYHQLADYAARIAAGLLQLGIKAGDRVSLACPNIPQFPMIYYGILSAGAVVVPLNILLKPDEIAYHLADSDSSAFLCFEGTEELSLGYLGLSAFEQVGNCKTFVVITGDITVEDWCGQVTLSSLVKSEPLPAACSCNADDIAVILYTSGTTGKAKGAELTHHNLAMNALSCSLVMATDVKDVHLVVLPLFHSFAQTVHLLQSVTSASTMVFMVRFDVGQTLRLLVQERVTIFAAVPTIYIALNGEANRLSDQERRLVKEKLRLCISGGGPMPVEVLKAFEDNFQVTMLEGYGLSETSPAACFNTLDQERVPGSIGRPLPGVIMRIVDDHGVEVLDGQSGELIIHGHNVMKGYFNKPEQTASVMKNGWFYSGDIARRDAAGNYYIVDRKKDIIIRGGFNVYPREVEEVLIEHPDILQAAVIGVPDEHYIEEVMACLVLRQGSGLSSEDVISWVRERVSDYKYPRQVQMFKEFPINATGKVVKRRLREWVKGRIE
ncbi:long-chain-fatty-acid--CoA ligase [Endozoicomonas ascidiicola]|uniref:long-chain-fatty-acid--CoA ligase n=1 Tax=Endozoicomonas ascidiicola TaxID=1698521 RepID=UPI0008310416|nr:long-chain fatty acid--CoA ligase [Endozoicomonas ascidiicola]